MEHSVHTKPPWIVPASQWQRSILVATPDIQYVPWTETISVPLLTAKDRISRLETMKRWELVKKMVNPYEIVYTHEDKFFHPSIAVIKPLSRSYFKMIEMAHVLELFERLPRQQSKLRTAHVAEGPGGFIQAVVDLCERNKKILQSSVAMTLKPTDQRVPGWRRASAFLHHHREVKLHYGADSTGDVYVQANQDSFVEAVAPGVHLFTADGGFDFSVNYQIQEQRVFRLLVSSAITGLRCLLTDGAFVLKIFDMFSPSTQFLVTTISRCFKEWILYKPSLSRPCNSERYFLGRGFKGLPVSVYETLLRTQQEVLRDLYPIDTARPADPYFSTHIQANTDDQLAAIEKAEMYANRPEVWYTTQLLHDFQKSLIWCERFHIPYKMTKPLDMSSIVPFQEYTSEPAVAQQSQSPDDGSSPPAPCDPASQA